LLHGRWETIPVAGRAGAAVSAEGMTLQARCGALIGPIPVMLGTFMIVFELGQPFRALNLFKVINLSPMSIGTWLLAGFIVNRFRGDERLLGDAHDYLLNHTGKPVYGVIPYISDLGLPQEDSVGFKAGLFSSTRPDCTHVEVVLIDLPHISNFTDIEPL